MTRRTGRQRRRSLTAVAGAAVFALLVSACGGSSSGGGGSVEDSEITLSVQNALVPQFKTYAAAYEKKYPDRKVTVRSLPDDPAQYIQQLTTAKLGNKLPDVLMNIDIVANQLAAGNITMDMADWLKEGKSGLRGADFLPQFLGQYRPTSDQEAVTGLPVSADSTTLYYNKDVFKKAGVDEYPEADWTWDDLYRVAEKIQKKTSGKYDGLTAPLGAGDQPAVYAPVIHANGGYVYDPKTKKSGIGRPAAIKAWTKMLEAYGKTSRKYSADFSTQPKFEQGQSAMAFSVRATVPTVKDGLKGGDWDVQPMPTMDGKPTVGGGSYGLSIGKTSKNQEAAWAFLAWFYKNNGGMKLAQASGQVVPPTEQGLKGGTWRDFPAPPANVDAFAENAEKAYLAPALPGDAQKVLSESVTKAVQEVELKNRSVKAAFGNAEKAVNEALASAE